MPFDGPDFADAAILRAARDGIAARERWTQGRASIQLPSGPAHCVMGWIEVAGASSPAEIERIVACHLYPELPWHRRVESYVGTIGDPRAAAVIAFRTRGGGGMKRSCDSLTERWHGSIYREQDPPRR